MYDAFAGGTGRGQESGQGTAASPRNKKRQVQKSKEEPALKGQRSGSHVASSRTRSQKAVHQDITIYWWYDDCFHDPMITLLVP